MGKENFDNTELEEKTSEITLKSELYNQNTKIDKRDEEGISDAIMWGCVIGFALFFVLLIMIILFTM